MNKLHSQPVIDGLILAGGESRRMGEDKASILVSGKSLLQHQIEWLCPEVQQVYIAANVNTLSIKDASVYFLADALEGREGPLAGLLAGLQATQASQAEYLWVLGCDNFGLTASLYQQLMQTLLQSGADIAYIRAGDRDQPLMAVLRCGLRDALAAYLQQGQRSVFGFYRSQNTVTVEVSADSAWYNLNTPQEVEQMKKSISG